MKSPIIRKSSAFGVTILRPLRIPRSFFINIPKKSDNGQNFNEKKSQQFINNKRDDNNKVNLNLNIFDNKSKQDEFSNKKNNDFKMSIDNPENKDKNNDVINNKKSIEINDINLKIQNNNKSEKENVNEIQTKNLIETDGIILKINPEIDNNEIHDKDNNKNIQLNINSNIENKYISFSQNNFTDNISEENENKNNDLDNNENKDFILIPNKELFKICGTNSDINDINERVYDKKILNKYMTYPFDESNIFMILKKPKEKVKDNIFNLIKERLKNKKMDKSNKKFNNKNFIEIKGHNKIESKEIKINNFINHSYHIINNSKEKKQKTNDNIIQINQKDIKNGEFMKNNRKYRIEKVNSSNNSSQRNINENINQYDNKIIKDIYNNKKDNRNINNPNNDFKDINKDNSSYIYSLDKRVEKVREVLNSINVIDTLSEQAGIQCYKGKNNIDDELYFEKAKNLNNEFYSNLDVKFNQIEEFLNQF